MSESIHVDGGFDRLRELEKDLNTLRKEHHEDNERLRRRLEVLELNGAVQQTKYETILEKLESLSSTVANLTANVTTITQKPAKKWDDTVSQVIKFVVEAVLILVAVKVGLK